MATNTKSDTRTQWKGTGVCVCDALPSFRNEFRIRADTL